MNRFLLSNLVFALRVAVTVGLAVYALQCAGALATRLVVARRSRAASDSEDSIGRSRTKFTAMVLVSIVSMAVGFGFVVGGFFASMVRLATRPYRSGRIQISQRRRHQARHRPREARGVN